MTTREMLTRDNNYCDLAEEFASMAAEFSRFGRGEQALQCQRWAKAALFRASLNLLASIRIPFVMVRGQLVSTECG